MKKLSNHASSVVTVIVFITLINIQYSLAQASGGISSGQSYYKDKQVFRLKAYTTLSKIQWKDVIYKFPEFQEGKVTMREGASPDKLLKMNLNVYPGKMEYITDKGDTIALEKVAAIKSVTIGNHLFYNDYPHGSYVEKINQTTPALGDKPLIKVMMESGSGEVFAATDWNSPTSRYDRLYIKDDEYFFINQTDKIYKGTQPAFLKLFHDSKKEIKKFIKTNKINFKVKEDLLKLLEFSNGKK